ncbi:MAG TPA: SDR family oxidoreductase [Steroidobacteraceae bacterium]|nr:SDR family oxidoreductase [Steroidobacteraceae bacterium]
MKAFLLLCLLGWAPGAPAADRPVVPEPAPNPGTALVTGSDRGIGLALTREFESRGWRVIATCRDPAKATELANFAHDHPTVSVEKLDVSDDAAIDALAAKLKGRPIDALVNNAGVSGSVEGQTLSKLDPEDFGRVLQVNSYAPLRVSAAFLELVAASRQRKIIGMSSGYGSLTSVREIAAQGYPNAYFYAMSKAALNMGLREFAFEVAPRHVTTVLLSPGAVDTDMQRAIRDQMAKIGKPITSPELTAAESAHSLVLTIEQLKPEQNGKFLTRGGAEIPW